MENWDCGRGIAPRCLATPSIAPRYLATARVAQQRLLVPVPHSNLFPLSSQIGCRQIHHLYVRYSKKFDSNREIGKRRKRGMAVNRIFHAFSSTVILDGSSSLSKNPIDRGTYRSIIKTSAIKDVEGFLKRNLY